MMEAKDGGQVESQAIATAHISECQRRFIAEYGIYAHVLLVSLRWMEDPRPNLNSSM